MTRFRRVLLELRSGREVDTFITIVAAVVLSVLNLLGFVSSKALQGATSALLALIAVNLLVLRSRLESPIGRSPSPVLTELNQYPDPFEADMNRVGDLWIGGGSIDRLSPYYIHHIRRRLELGHSVRLLLVDPDSPAAALMGERYPRPLPPGQFQEKVRAALTHIEGLMANANGNLEVRLTNDELGFGWTHLGFGTSRAKLYLQYFGYRNPDLRNLKLIMSPSHGEIYDFHMSQLEALWLAATPWSP